MKYLKGILISSVLVILSVTVYGQFDVNGLKLMEVVDKVSRYYVDSINEEEFVEETIVHMLHELDPHSSYISADELKEINEQMTGEFEGIGVSFNILDDTIFIVNTIQGGPSEKVGILAGDRIVKVGEENVAGIGITNAGVQKRLKGEKGTRVDVTVYRKTIDKNLDFTIIRDKIPVYSLDASYMIDDHIGYIKLSRFSRTTAEEFEEAVINLKKEGMEDLILDLSGNGGGYLRIAIELADQFLTGGRRIVYTEGKVPRRDYVATGRGLLEEGKLVIMINEVSASASEIVSGAVQDWDRGVLVGRRSFGKGLVQQPFRLSDGSEMRLTIARYYTPTGRLIQKPYDEGYDDYSMDIWNRYNSGELMGEDSVLFPKDEQFKTLVKGRTVYGGGGIMPDYFIPVDTLSNTAYLNSLIRSGVFNQFVLGYMDNNRTSLERKYKTFESFRKNYDSAPLLQELKEAGDDGGVEFDQEEWDRSKNHIRVLLKAYIARDLWESGHFFQIYNEIDPIYRKAVEVLEHPEYYVEKL